MRTSILLAACTLIGCSKGSEPPPSVANRESSGSSTRPTNEERRLLRQCDTGTDAACNELEGLYLRTERRQESTDLVKRLCESGRRYFCPTFAFVLANGDGVPADPARARQLFEDTCKDDPSACSEFGNLYLAGRGVPKNVELGCTLVRLACALRDEDACRDLRDCN